MKLFKRTLAMLLVLTMVLGMVPFAAFAEETTEGTEGTLPVPTHMATKPANGEVDGEPFDITASRNYRIPGLVNHDGKLVAVADVRYNEEYDGGGIDIVVSRSADGNTWNYTFPAYLGDNGNEYNGESSTIMDPLIISDGETLYLLYDLFSAGYSLGTWNTTYGFWATGTGFDSQGRLRLGTTYNGAEDSWNYYLENGQIKDSDGNAVEGYTVDAWFNVYQNGTYVSNLFFKDSPYMVYPTSYIAMQTSTDGGSSWSDPQLLNIKENGPTWEVLGPGTGLVTMDGNLAFTTYDGSNIYLIYGKDNDWTTVKTNAANNESSIVELADGTIRAFVKNNNNQICYVDFTKTETGYTAGSQVRTGCTSQSWCMVSSMYYSKTLGGKDVILVTCPTSSNGRYYGKMHVFTLNDDNTMNLVGAYEINGADDFFAYSDMAELEDGSIALLYEDDCKYYNWSDDREHASHISYRKVNLETALGVEFDVDYDVFVWNADNSAGEIRVPTTAGVNHVHVQPKTLDTMTVAYSAYDMVLCKDEEDNCTAEFTCTNVHTGKAIVSLALTDALQNATDVKGFVVESNGSITSVFDVEKDETHVTFEAPHFSVVGIAAMTEEEIAQKNAVEVTLYSDETKTITLEGVAATGSATSDVADVAWRDISTTKTYVLAGIGTADTSYTADTIKLDDCLYTFTASGNGYIVQSKSNPSLYLNTVQNSAGIPNGTNSRVVTVTPLADGSDTFYLHNTYDDGKTGYLYFWRDGKNRFDRNGSVHDSCKFYLYRPAAENETSSTEIPGYVRVTTVANGEYLIAAPYNNTYYVLRPSTETANNDTAKRSHVARVTDQTVTEGVVATEITITGKTEDTTSVNIGGILYNITVEMDEVDVTLYAGDSKTVTLDGVNYTTSSISKQPQDTVATIGSVVGSPIKDKELRAVTSVDDLSADKQYLIVANRPGGIGGNAADPANSVLTSVKTDDGGLHMNGPASADSTDLWTITPVTGGYTITQGDKYLSFGNESGDFTDVETVLALQYRTNGGYRTGWTIERTVDNSTYYLSDLRGTASENAYGYGTLADDGNYWTIYEVASIDVGYTTDITFNGVARGTTDAVIGHTKFNITVKERIVQDITLTAGETETFTIYGQAYSMDDVTTQPDGTYATLDSVVATGPILKAVTAIESGKQYLIVNKSTGDVLSDTVVSVPGQWDNKTGLDTTGKAAVDSTELWTITGTEDSCTIVQNGKHLTIAGFYANMSDTVTNLTLEYTESGWTIYDDETTGNVSDVGTGGYYLSDSVGNNYTAGALGTNDTANTARYWEIYEIDTVGDTTITFTGVAEGGPTTAVIGDVTYNITVEASQWIDVDVHLYVDETKKVVTNGVAYTDDDVDERPDENIATLDSVVDISEITREPVLDTSIDSGKQYLLINTRANKALSNSASNNGRLSLQGTLADFQSATLWTITKADGDDNYYIQDSNGKYLTFSRPNDVGRAEIVNDPVVIQITPSTIASDAWQLYYSGQYLNDHNQVDAGGYQGLNDGGSQWRFYEIAVTNETLATEVTFTGVAEGETQAIIGNIRYNIYVTEREQEIVDVDLYVGETKDYTIDGVAYTDANVTKAEGADSVVQTQVVGDHIDGKELRVATEIISGRKYMLMNTRVDETLRNVPNGNRLFLDGTLNAEDTTAIWTITAVEGRENGYTVQDANNKYLQIPAGGQAGLSDTSITLIIEPNGTDEGNVRWQIKHGGQYLNSHDSTNDAGGYNVDGDGGSQWVLYEVAESTTEVSFTGLTEGETQVKVGHVTYNITVSYYEEDVTAFVGAPVSVIPNGTVTQAAIDDFNAAHGGKVTVALSNGKLVFNGVAETDEFTAILGNTRYNITVIRAVENITLYEGISRTFVIDGYGYSMDDATPPDPTSATLDSVNIIVDGGKELRAITSADGLVDGKQYLIVNNRAAGSATGSDPTHSVMTGTAGTYSGTAGLQMNGPASADSTDLWSIAPSDNGYVITYGGKYLYMEGNAVTLVDTEQESTLEYVADNNGWRISQGNLYLSDWNGVSSTLAHAYNAAGDGGNYWTIYEVVAVDGDHSTEVTFTGVKAGTTTTATVGHVTYNITVEKNDIRNITLYVGVTQNDFIEGFGYDNTHSTQPDNTYAYIHSVTTEDGGTKVVFSGVAKTPAGEVTTATVGHVIYHITVEDLHSGEDVPGFNCIIGEGEYESGANVIENLNGKEVKSLRISEGMEFNLGVDIEITDDVSIEWVNTNPDIATVDETGKITAVSEGTTLIKATVTKNGVSETMAVHVTVVPSMVEGYSADEISHVVYYIDTVHMTDPFYTMFLSSENTTGPVAEHTMVMVSQGEVIVLQRPKEAAFALVWTSDPWDHHALTYMAATGTRGEYFPLQSDNGVLETGTVNGIAYYKGSTAYNNIVNFGNAAGASWQTALDKLLEYNVHIGEDIWQEFGCDGAMSMTRKVNDDYPNTATSLSFISEKLPEVSKTINGILGNSGKKAEWKLYQEGMYTEVGEYVYYNITVTQDAPHSWQLNEDGSIKTDAEGRQLAALQYDLNAMLSDWLIGENEEQLTNKNNPPYFYTKELDAEDGDQSGNGIANDDGYIADVTKQKNAVDIHEDLNAGWTQEQIDAGSRTLTYYVVYRIQQEDFGQLLKNGVDLDYTYGSAYSHGIQATAASASASMRILGASLQDLVVDFGQPVTFTISGNQLTTEISLENTVNAQGGLQYGDIQIAQTVAEGTTDLSYSITYTPNRIMHGYDVVYLMDANNNLVNYFRVYPATTVFYEEGFLLDDNNGWNVENATKGTEGQTYETLVSKTNPYGYDPIYADDLNGASGSYISANTIGANTSFTFTGTGFDLYANCDSESGYVAITVRKNNADDSKTVVKLMTVNTKAKVGDTAATAGQSENQYHMPIVSVQDLDHATYTVEIRKIMQIERDVVIDGVRIYNTVADTSVFKENLEDAPKFFEMRDYVLTALNIGISEQYGSLDQIANQIYSNIADSEAPAAIVGNAKIDTVITTTTTTTKYQDGGTSVGVVVEAVHTETAEDGTVTETEEVISRKITYRNAEGSVVQEANESGVVETETDVKTRTTNSIQDTLDNGPKNELFLYANQSLTFKVNTSRMMQLGLKAPTGAPATYQIQVNGATVKEGTMNTSVDMFYNLNDPTSVNIASQATITATGGKENSDEGSANLVDGINSSLYKFYDAQMTDEQSVILTYEEARSMNAMAIAFENVGETDGDNYAFTYSILARNGSGEYDTIVENATANRTDDSSQSYTFPEKTYSEVKIVMHSCKSGENNGWPAIAEFEVYSGVEYTVTVSNTGNAILSVTKLKICDDPNAKFVPLTVEDIEQILLAAGFTADEEAPADPSVPEESKPQETTPEETKPEESKPAETTPEETKPESTGCAKDESCILSEFSDIVTTEWYHDGVHFCVAEGLMNGMGEGIFAPNDSTTRAQLVTMLYRLMGSPKAEGKTEPFTDVAEGEWYYDAIVWAYSENVVKGISETEFAPNANVTREQVATILHRFLATPEGTGKLDSFSDAASVSTYAKDALVWAVGEGLINGVAQTNGKVLLDPTGTATRAQIATILYRYLENA